jgi:hypothetical protein
VTLTIELPLPPKQLGGNTRVHWTVRSKTTKQYKQDTTLLALNAFQGSLFNPNWKWDPTKTTRVKATYYAHRGEPPVPGYRPTDDDNAIRALKTAIDGFKNANLIKDDSSKYLKWSGVTIYRNKKEVERNGGGRPRVVVVLEQDGEE